MPSASPKLEVVIFPANETILSFDEVCIHCMDCLFDYKWGSQKLSLVRILSRNPAGSTSNNVRFSCDVACLFTFVHEDVVHTIQKLSSFQVRCVLFTLSRDMTIKLGVWFIFNLLTSITMWWTRSQFSSVVAAAGSADLYHLQDTSLPS